MVLQFDHDHRFADHDYDVCQSSFREITGRDARVTLDRKPNTDTTTTDDNLYVFVALCEVIRISFTIAIAIPRRTSIYAVISTMASGTSHGPR
jgi:hypothetical protein